MLRRVAAGLFVAFCVPAVFAQTSGGTISGTVNDAEGHPIPGVDVRVTGDNSQRPNTGTGNGRFWLEPAPGSFIGGRVSTPTTDLEWTATTDSDGRYRLVAMLPGDYTVAARLSGFRTGTAKVRLNVAETTTVDFALETRCMTSICYFDTGWTTNVREAVAVAYMEIRQSEPPKECATDCVPCTMHSVRVHEIVTRDGVRVPRQNTAALAQINAGVLPDFKGDEAPFRTGERFVAFVEWDENAKAFRGPNRVMYTFPVVDGRVVFERSDAPGIRNGMTVREFMRAVEASMRSLP